jgi:hypothetical protein
MGFLEREHELGALRPARRHGSHAVSVAPDGEIAWAARVFLLLGKDGLIRQDYQLTVKPLAA